MLLRIIHQTDLTYTEPISESVMELRVSPRQEQDQHRLAFTLAIGPAANVNSYFDWVGNTVHTFSVNEFHKQIRIVATSVVETERVRSDPQKLPDTWPIEFDGDWSMLDYVNFAGPVVDSPLLDPLVQSLGAKRGTALGEIALRMVQLIDTRFEYRRGITDSASPITDILKHGKGVCQDFTHLMIGLARKLAIPARYVSGLVHPDARKFRGYTQTHAWCELFFPSTGWIGFDPTNRCVAGGNFVKVAVGRDYRDVPPNKGVYRGNADETIDVQVKTEELKKIPPELAAERFQALTVPAWRGAHVSHGPRGALHQDQQQQ
ncbi:MAG: transglutaminase family protein [Tepidisphaeraceae bacterium]